MAKTEEKTSKEGFNIEVVSLSAHLPIDIKPNITTGLVLNGENNANYVMYQDAYEDSPTNASIIDAFVAYIYANGLIDVNEKDPIKQKANVEKHLSRKDARLICEDYKKYGAFAVQVIWNAALDKKDKKPLQIKYFKVFKLGLEIDEEMEVTGYQYSFNWREKGRYVPIPYPMYTGTYKDKDVELIIFQRPSSNDFFSQPDYVSGIRYAQLEGELQNSAYNHVMNGFQGTKVVNCNNGVPPTEELKEQYKREIISKLTGTDNTNKVIVSFNKTAEQAIVVTDVPIVELNQQYVQFGEDARQGIISAHKASPVIFANTKDGGGLSNNANEIEMATAMQYRKNINPMREDILVSLMSIFKDIDSNVELGFLDFETFSGDKVDEVVTTDNTVE